MSDDLVQIARQRIDDAQRTHWEGCERDWVNVGTWLYPGYRIVVQGLPPQVTNAHGHVLTTAALWKMYVEDPETPDEPRAG